MNLILAGSRVEPDTADEISDYDISVFLTDPAPFIAQNDWLSQIGKVWASLPEEDEDGESLVLVIFEGGVKADFRMMSVDELKECERHLWDEFDIGYRVLVDKDGLTDRMMPPSFSAYKGKRPSKTEFHRCVTEFWFEAHLVARYLKRDDLWAGNFRDWTCKTRLIRMIEWRENAMHNWDVRTSPLGRRMKTWVSSETWRSLHDTFAHFESGDSWRALDAMTRMFRKVAVETGDILGFVYEQDLEKHISGLILQLKEQ